MMRLLHPHISLAFLLIALAAAPHLRAQQPPQQEEPGDGRGPMSVLGPNGGGTAGTVSAITGSEITIRNEQGETYKIETSANTRFRKEREEDRKSVV